MRTLIIAIVLAAASSLSGSVSREVYDGQAIGFPHRGSQLFAPLLSGGRGQLSSYGMSTWLSLESNHLLVRPGDFPSGPVHLGPDATILFVDRTHGPWGPMQLIGWDQRPQFGGWYNRPLSLPPHHNDWRTFLPPPDWLPDTPFHWQPPVVPEPASLVMFVLGLGLLVAGLRPGQARLSKSSDP